MDIFGIRLVRDCWRCRRCGREFKVKPHRCPFCGSRNLREIVK